MAILAAPAISLALIVERAEHILSGLNDHALMPGVSRAIGRVAQVEVSGRDSGVEFGSGWLGNELEVHILCHGPAAVEHGHDRIVILAVAIIV